MSSYMERLLKREPDAMTNDEARRVVGIQRKELEIATRALKWYASPDNWHRDSWNILAVVDPPDYGNPGGKARRALERMRKAKA